ncbi:hypothetical protein [Iodobacter fluviatilis]|uniref:DUF2958 domain-containing protein n=1 Tax=Iodobacter fluviatilis TaxID=537 RepID=A0A7G3GEW7_9NEIS|nr:hypothetical protein [Iodobacter fluviatilis]QBC45876.1 hypothetical protein C1H71_20245 [Iodobacter fluviatilis]
MQNQNSTSRSTTEPQQNDVLERPEFKHPTFTPWQAALMGLKLWMPKAQLGAMVEGLRSREERQYFRDKSLEMAVRVLDMPKTYEQDGKGDAAIVYLHYFIGGFDFYITEKDVTDGVTQAFGFVNSLDCGELGYISITEIVSCGAELDLFFEPTPLAEIKKKHGIPLADSDD